MKARYVKMWSPSILESGNLALGGARTSDFVVAAAAAYTYSTQLIKPPPGEEEEEGEGRAATTKPLVAKMGSSSSWVRMGLKVRVCHSASFLVQSLIMQQYSRSRSILDSCLMCWFCNLHAPWMKGFYFYSLSLSLQYLCVTFLSLYDTWLSYELWRKTS